MFLDRIAISEIKTKSIYFHFQKSKSFIYENLLKTRFFSYEKNLVCVPKLTLLFKHDRPGSVISPNWPDLEILDFEVSKIWENIAKKYFLKKNQKILGKLLCLNTSFLT